MTDFKTEHGLGNRIQAARKVRGIRTAADLAAAIPGGKVTEAIIQNIEAGRKTDITVSQLLNIAFAIRIPPIYLLAALGDPEAKLDLANLSDDLTDMTPAELDAWINGSTDGAYRWKTVQERSERAQLDAFREYQQLLAERTRLRAIAEIEKNDALTESQLSEQTWETTQDRIDNTQRRISQITEYLGSAGWQLKV